MLDIFSIVPVKISAILISLVYDTNTETFNAHDVLMRISSNYINLHTRRGTTITSEQPHYLFLLFLHFNELDSLFISLSSSFMRVFSPTLKLRRE